MGMWKRFEAFNAYYRLFFEELFSQLWKSWRTEVSPALIVAILVYGVSYHHDPNAKMAFTYTCEACVLYIGAWALYHLVRTPWKLTLGPPRPAVKSRVKRPVDLQGDLLEIYIRYPDDKFFPVTRAYVFIYARITNLGTDEVAITAFGLRVGLGDFDHHGTLIEIPDSLRIKRPREGVFLGSGFDEFLLTPSLSSQERIYGKGKPQVGWLAFEVTVHGSEEIPNVNFNLWLRDSFGGDHCITRSAGVYRTTGQLV
jgi:hypothetical protein